MADQHIHQYRLGELLGTGGMGMVYAAHDTHLDRPVVLKFLGSHVASTPEARVRFEREAKAAATLNHPNIITIYEIGDHDGKPFIAMPYAPGQTLSDLVRLGPIDPNRAANIVGQVALGLDRAHAAGILHRDIKPGNILVEDSGRVKILDFGLAIVSSDTRITREDSKPGTAAYMSPEQARGDEIDGRSDIFSLGSVFYEMLTRRLPFRGDRPASVLYAIESKEPTALTEFEPDVPDTIVSVVARMMAKDPAHRYATGAEVAADLGVSGPSDSDPHSSWAPLAPASKPSSSRRDKAVAALLIALLAVGAIVWWPQGEPTSSGPPEDDRIRLAVLPFANLSAAEDEYLADGITEEINSRLAAVPELGIISRTSTLQYKNTDKPLPQIADELNVQYLLEGTVQWDKTGSVHRVKITPQLIRAEDDTNVWSQPFQRDVENIFALQSEIAEQVIEKLNVQLLADTRQPVDDRPTQSFAAYQAYRKGVQAARAAYSRETNSLATTMLQRAVRMDPNYAAAYAELSRVHSRSYHLGHDRTTERLELAKAAADRALELNPRLPQARIAMAYYHYWGFKAYEAALSELDAAAAGRTHAPGPAVLEARGYILRRQGNYAEAATSLEEALRLSPRDGELALEVANTNLGRWEFARANQFYDLAISLEPSKPAIYTLKIRNQLLWDGDLVATRAILEAMPSSAETRSIWFRAIQEFYEGNHAEVVAQLNPWRSHTYQTHAQTVPLSLTIAWAHDRLDDATAASDAYRESLDSLTAALAARPDDFRIHMALGLTRAGLGDFELAMAHGDRAVEIYPLSVDAWAGPILQRNRLFLLAQVGQTEAALAHMEKLLSSPNPGASPALFAMEPRLDALRNHPRFDEILAEAQP